MSDTAAEFIQAEDDTLHGRYLTFVLDEECYGIEIRYVTDIIQMQPIATLPGAENYLKGIINLRGEIIPVMDVRLRFGKPALAYNDRTCVIVMRFSDVSIGLIVDCVSEVLQILDEDVSQPPKINGASNRFIKGIGKVGQEVKLLLDCEKLIENDKPEISE